MSTLRSKFKRHKDGTYHSKAVWTTGRNYENAGVYHVLNIEIEVERKKFWRTNLYWVRITNPDDKGVYEITFLKDRLDESINAVHQFVEDIHDHVTLHAV